MLFFLSKKQSTRTDLCLCLYWGIFHRVVLNTVIPVVLFFCFGNIILELISVLSLCWTCVFIDSTLLCFFVRVLLVTFQRLTILSSPNLHGLYRWTDCYFFSKRNCFACFLLTQHFFAMMFWTSLILRLVHLPFEFSWGFFFFELLQFEFLCVFLF